jgi:predicted glycogen debranching enzyme
MPWQIGNGEPIEPLLTREWLVTNGLGGYASGTLAGVLTRRYHGLLIAALAAPYGRRVMLNDIAEIIRMPDGSAITLGGEEESEDTLKLHASAHLAEFRMEDGLPTWRFEVGGMVIEKQLLLPYRQNTVHITYRMFEGEQGLRIELRPAINFRGHEEPVSTPLSGPYVLTAVDDQIELSESDEAPPLRMLLHANRAAFTLERRILHQLLFRIEESRGYEFRGDLWSPGYFRGELAKGHNVTLIASTENWETIRALQPQEAVEAERGRRQRLVSAAPPEARSGLAAELVVAADQFLITPAGRVEDQARARAAGEEVRTVIAGYHWFTDWGRDTMISLEGLTLSTGRQQEAKWILQTFAHYVRHGLIPNMFPEGEKEGLYHTADASLWFFHAVDRYLKATDDRETLRTVLPKLIEIAEHHLRGTRFGIGVDPVDGLLSQGQENYQLTWMDAKVDDWVVTPRRGKAVEINALWYNALCLTAQWVREERAGDIAQHLEERAAFARESFNRRFWYDEGGYLYDVIDGENGDDPALRPNQIFAISLANPVLDAPRWQCVLNVVKEKLLTPVGLRSLAPGHPDYKPRYFGDLRSRDAAYHQGTVWGWLIGPFIDAWLRVYPDDVPGAREFLDGFGPHLGEACIGSISEIFDAEPPYTPRGCIAQAWSVAEVLRCLVKTAR